MIFRPNRHVFIELFDLWLLNIPYSRNYFEPKPSRKCFLKNVHCKYDIWNIICNNLSWFRKFQMEIDHKWNSGLNTRIIVDVIAVTTAVQGRISKLKFTTWSFPQDFVLCLMSLSCSILEILSPNIKKPIQFFHHSHLFYWTSSLSFHLNRRLLNEEFLIGSNRMPIKSPDSTMHGQAV